MTEPKGVRHLSNKSRSDSKKGSTKPKEKVSYLQNPKVVAILEHCYTGFAYCVYTFVMFFAIFYLAYIFRVQVDRKLLLNYQPVKDYMGLNSYSLLTPLLSILIATALGYTTRTRVRLSDGDFFGTLGIILFLTCITVHDAIGIQRLQLNKNKVLKESGGADSEWETWEKAWSTRPICVKIYKHRTVDDPIPSDAILGRIVTPKPNEYDIEPAVDIKPPVGSEDYKFENLMHKVHGDESCAGFHSKVPVQRPRIWMKAMQIDLKCCGPYANISKWRELVLDTQCDEGVTQSCGIPFINYINGIFHLTEIIMLTEAALLILMVLLYTVHFVLMKRKKLKITKAYSLLRITSQTVLHGYQDSHKEHHLQTQHYHQHLHHPGHPHYHRHAKKRRIQSIVAEHKDVSEPPRLEKFIAFPLRDKEHEELEALFLSKSTRGKGPVFPRADSLDGPDPKELVHVAVQQRRGLSFAATRGTLIHQTAAEAREKAQLRASKAQALAEAAYRSDDDEEEKDEKENTVKDKRKSYYY